MVDSEKQASKEAHTASLPYNSIPELPPFVCCRWVIYNDQKVCASEKPPKDLGYIYFYQRIPS